MPLIQSFLHSLRWQKAEDAGNCGVLRIMVSKVRNDVSCCGKDCQPVSGKMDFL